MNLNLQYFKYSLLTIQPQGIERTVFVNFCFKEYKVLLKKQYSKVRGFCASILLMKGSSDVVK